MRLLFVRPAYWLAHAHLEASRCNGDVSHSGVIIVGSNYTVFDEIAARAKSCLETFPFQKPGHRWEIVVSERLRLPQLMQGMGSQPSCSLCSASQYGVISDLCC